jgi:4-carboxymuconolactone decarboxylase
MIPARTYEERRATAEDVFRGFRNGDGDVGAIYDTLIADFGPYGSFAVDYVMGDVWYRPHLSRRDRSMIVIALLATQRAHEELGAHVEIGLNHGLTRDEIDEIVLQVAAYAGCPAAVAAARVINATFCRLDGVDKRPPREPAESKDDETRRRDAFDVQRTMFGTVAASTPDEVLSTVVDTYGPVGQLAFEWALGEVWARPQLSRRDRSLIVIAILAFLSKPRELAVHVPGAIHHGATQQEVVEVMVQLCVYGGFPRAVEGYLAAKEAFAVMESPA